MNWDDYFDEYGEIAVTKQITTYIVVEEAEE